MFFRLSILIICFLSNSYAYAQDLNCLFTSSKHSVVQIEFDYRVRNEGVGKSKGSGFIISPSGHILTNAHVVRPQIAGTIESSKISVKVGSITSDALEATLVHKNDLSDVALLKISASLGRQPWQFLPISERRTFPVGDEMTAMGFPLNSDLTVTTRGRKTAENVLMDGNLMPFWQTDLPLNHGNSGGPVFDPFGTIIGIATAKSINGQSMSYILPISMAQSFLDIAGVVATKAGHCAIFPECEAEIHGIDRYAIDERVNEWGNWRGGGYTRGAYCNDFLIKLRTNYPNSQFTFIRDDEISRKTPFPESRAEYRYYCEYRRIETPIYKRMRSMACLK
jgi:Trypsin-like peptidase domain